VGTLSSGNFSPVLGHGIGMGLLAAGLAPGQNVTAVLRGREINAEVTALPFVQKES
jgi:aminomethyltransferase